MIHRVALDPHKSFMGSKYASCLMSKWVMFFQPWAVMSSELEHGRLSYRQCPLLEITCRDITEWLATPTLASPCMAKYSYAGAAVVGEAWSSF